jgi:ATP-dependent RNA helicase DeaD
MTEARIQPAGAPPTAKDEPDEAPAALPTFDLLPLSTEMRETLADMGYLHPTPVQLAVWEPATRGRDAVVQARTGTGKTAAFGLPIVDHIVRRSLAEPQVLVLCPTRELAVQVSAEIERLAKRKGTRVVAVYGGAPMPRQVDAIAAGAQVVVGTPGRVLDHIRRGTFTPKNVRLLVLDESDEMLSMGFERELTAILDHLPPTRQTLLFSATVPPDIERIARSKLRTPEFVTLSGDHIGALEIDHFVYMVARDKTRALIRVLEVENPESAIIFCNTRDETEQVAQALQRQGFDADWLNGDLPQSEREKVMTATREGRLRFLVATDVAARGIDVSHLTHVINHDFPQDAEGYVHRTGRTGRAGRTGMAISLVTPRDIGGLYILRLTYKIRPIEKQIPSEGELKTRAEADLVTMLADAFAAKGTHPDDLALARRLLSHDDHEAIVAGLLRDHLGARPTLPDEASAARRATYTPRRPLRREAPQHRAAEAPRPVEARAPIAATPPVRTSEPQPAAPPAPAPARDDRPQGPPPSTPHARERRPARLRREGRDEGRGRAAPESSPGTDRDREPLARSSEEQRRAAPVRHADFTTWQPPEEDGDDQPIFGATAELRRGAAPDVKSEPREMSGRGRAQPVPARSPGTRTTEPRTERPDEERDPEYVELYVNVGRRDGARAADIAKALVERAGLDKDDVRRIRVRERNSFVSVPRAQLTRVVDALAGLTISGKAVTAEQARGRVESTDPPLPVPVPADDKS